MKMKEGDQILQYPTREGVKEVVNCSSMLPTLPVAPTLNTEVELEVVVAPTVVVVTL
jgi:hypothetical protein